MQRRPRLSPIGRAVARPRAAARACDGAQKRAPSRNLDRRSLWFSASAIIDPHAFAVDRRSPTRRRKRTHRATCQHRSLPAHTANLWYVTRQQGRPSSVIASHKTMAYTLNRGWVSVL